ncbi:MAG: flagellar biosynthesis anti-sigma factor FlgM [Phycisphaerae bacterium]|jgi:anti-sigma28 factor (negative regulator of flagellin synthesis)|nr:flagellar biosynthesis anti-sigma factor FlgM [Phycisphaerae bacterium]
MYVNGVNPPTPPQSVEPVTTVVRDGGSAALPPTGDVVEISTVAKLAAQVHDVPEVRADLIARVKAEIETGVYETQERIDVTVDRLMDEFSS